jgi:hypothetical protein
MCPDPSGQLGDQTKFAGMGAGPVAAVRWFQLALVT